MRLFLTFCLGLVTLCAPALAERDKVNAYIFGNSLVHHLSETDETAVPHWLALMAKASGRDLGLDGQWGFLRDFARGGAVPNWSFRQVTSVWNRKSGAFRDQPYDTVLITPANFIQRQPPSQAFDGDISSPLTVALDVINQAEMPERQGRYFIYEGWPDMASFSSRFPPRKRPLRKYHAYAQSDYHHWFQSYVAALRADRPDLDIRLLPVSSILSAWLTGPLSDLAPTDLWVDADPHGTPTLYFLASLITYTTLFDTEAPANLLIPDSVDPRVKAAYADLARDAAERLSSAKPMSMDQEPQPSPEAPAEEATPEAEDASAPEAENTPPKPIQRTRIEMQINPDAPTPNAVGLDNPSCLTSTPTGQN